MGVFTSFAYFMAQTAKAAKVPEGSILFLPIGNAKL